MTLGFKRNDDPTGFEEDSVGFLLMEFGFIFPVIVADRWVTVHPVSWALKGLVLLLALIVWWFTIGWVAILVGVPLMPIGRSWSEMKERRNRGEQ